MKTKLLPKLILMFAFVVAGISASATTIEITAFVPGKEQGQGHPCVDELVDFIEGLDDCHEYLTRFDEAQSEAYRSKRTTRLYELNRSERRDTISLNWGQKERISVSIRYHPNSDHLDSIEAIKDSVVEIMTRHFEKVKVSTKNPQVVE